MDLIDRQEVDKIIDDLLENDNLQASPSVWHGLHMIKQLPSAQPEIIRCRDCIHWCNHARLNIPWCRELHIDRGADDYCSGAERRTDE